MMLPFRGLSSSARLGLMGGGLFALVGAEGALLWFLSSRAPAPVPATPLASSSPAPTPTEHIFVAPGAVPPSAVPPAPQPLPPGSLAPAPVPGAQNPKATGTSPLPLAPLGTTPFPAPVPGNSTALAANPKLAIAAQKFDQASAALKSGNKRGAVALWEEVARLAPDDLATRQNLALVYSQLNQPQSAIPHARAAVRIAPSNAKAQFQLAQMLLATKQLKAALDPLRATVRLAPQEREGHTLLARVLVDVRQPKAALEQWAFLANRDGHDIEAHLQAAAVANDLLRNPTEAEKWLRRSQSQNPRDPQAPLLLSQILMGRRDAKGAAAILTTAVKNAPDAFALYPALAQARTASKDRAGAISALQSALARVPKSGAGAGEAEGRLRVSLGQLLGDGKQPRQARDQFALAARLLPRDPEPRALGALAELDLKNISGATKLLAEAIALDPKNGRTRRLYAQTLAQSGQWKSADAQFQSYCANAPRDREALSQWARVARELKEPSREAGIWQKLALVDAKNPLVWSQLGEAQLRAKRKPEALQAFTRLAALTPRELTNLLRVAELQTEVGDKSAALGTLEKALDVRPDYAPAYLMVLRAGEVAGQMGNARASVVQHLAAHPQYGSALTGALKFYEDKKRPDEARALLNDVVARNPGATLAKKALAAYGSSPASAATKAP